MNPQYVLENFAHIHQGDLLYNVNSKGEITEYKVIYFDTKEFKCILLDMTKNFVYDALLIFSTNDARNPYANHPLEEFNFCQFKSQADEIVGHLEGLKYDSKKLKEAGFQGAFHI